MEINADKSKINETQSKIKCRVGDAAYIDIADWLPEEYGVCEFSSSYFS